MSREDSAVRRLDDIFAQENEMDISLGVEQNHQIQATREQVDEIARYYELYPQYTPAFNVIVEKSDSIDSILKGLDVFMCPDGESKPETSKLDEKIINFMDRIQIRRDIKSRIGIRSVAVRNAS